MKEAVKTHGLNTEAAIAELLVLATSPTAAGAETFGKLRTPTLFSRFIPMLFVGFAHNLILEQKVSVLGLLERVHPNTHADTLQHLFLYRERHAWSRARRLAASMRSVTGGARKPRALERAADGKPLAGGCCRSRKQQRLLIRHCMHAAAKYTNLTKRINKRGKANLGNKVREARARHAAKKVALADAVVRTLDYALYCTVV